ncbi:2-oxoglutarate ferredoxin oxidoreductase subunit gamma [Desulfosarcina sp. BuS5]|uniref:2-oxoacid:acceptor oxidoreductase family protein n=1 Tax=Desulfosarcina sp. BuS5 TaxID=933262 RepID=UPI000482A7E6|nr:2-oxoacid:acceptor oxidoreductase family protein [Desulfosarcina sp. BuS5]WDN89590.1 2-oxoglutarate ferredoxin oxidoreductase subunit gamma [Desulfosarcina sp. BuS5]
MTNSIETNKKRKEIIITGFGGQGIILIGRIMGKTAAIGDHMESTMVQSYGPESRGGACSAQVIISDKNIHFPYIKSPDILACMSQSGYDKYKASIKTGNTILVDQDLVRYNKKAEVDCFSIPATRMAEELGKTMMANIIMLGFVTAVTKVISMDAAKSTVAESVPKGTGELNIKAFDAGCYYGLAALKGGEKKVTGLTGAGL